MRRIGATERAILSTQSNLANSYRMLGRVEEALILRKEVYSGYLKLEGKEHEKTILEANNYASTLGDLKRFEEAKALLRKTIPVALRVLGESDDTTFRMRWNYATSLLCDDVATLDDLREAVTTLEETEQTARRVLGGSHPVVAGIELSLRDSRDALRARESGKKVNIITRPAWAARRPSSKQSK